MKQTLKKQISDYLMYGLTVPKNIRKDYKKYGEYKPTFFERFMFSVMKGRALKKEDYQ